MRKDIALVIGISMTVAGCAGLGMMGGMSAEQIAAAVKDKSSMASCTDFTGMGGQFRVMLVNNDKTFNTGGGETTVECGAAKVIFKDAGKSQPPVITPAPSTTTTIITKPTP